MSHADWALMEDSDGTVLIIFAPEKAASSEWARLDGTSDLYGKPSRNTFWRHATTTYRILHPIGEIVTIGVRRRGTSDPPAIKVLHLVADDPRDPAPSSRP